MKFIVFKITEIILLMLYIFTILTDRDGLPILVCALYAYHMAQDIAQEGRK